MVLVRSNIFWCQPFLDSRIDGMYGNFAGRDASRGMAKQSFDLGTTYIFSWRSFWNFPLDMLTPVDQSLDKLEDLKADEM